MTLLARTALSGNTSVSVCDAYASFQTMLITRPATPTTPLPREIISALSRWQAVRKGSWSSATAAEAQNGLLSGVHLAANSGRDALSRALSDLAQYLGFLVDAGLSAPNPHQWHRLAELEEATLALLRVERAATTAVDARKRILFLAPKSTMTATLLERLTTKEYRPEHLQETQQLLARIDPVGLAAVLIDQDHLADLGAVAERLEQVRSAEALGATIIFINRNRDLSARSAALSGGADASLEGEDLDHLTARIFELVNVRDRQEHLRILVVEDDRSQAMYCEAILRKQGIDVRVASSSRKALEEVISFAPDLMLVDLHMPEIDGMQLTTLIRDNPDLAMLPIVFLTGEQDEGRRYDALRAGGDDYLLKPVRPRHLVTAVVTRARRARALRQQFSKRATTRESRMVHDGEMIRTLRHLGEDRPCTLALLLAAADSGRFTAVKAHPVAEREMQYRIGQQLQAQLDEHEALANWHNGGFLILVERTAEAELLQRAEQIRLTISKASVPGSVSVSVLPLPPESLPPAETLIDLAERTLAVARHAGGQRVRLALAEAQTDLAPDLSLAIQKSLAVDPSASSCEVQYQPIVPLHGTGRPQYHLHLGLRVDLGGERMITRRQWSSLARHNQRSLALDLYAVRSAVEQTSRLRRRIQGLRILVAVSVESLLDPAFLPQVGDELQSRDLSDSGLVFSLDQSEALLHGRRVQELRQQLRELHIGFCLGRVALDGKGSSAIENLRPDLIAVDALSLRGTGQASNVLEIARDCGSEVIAHFITDSQTLAKLFALGVDYGMGSFIGAPSAQLDYDFGDFG